MKLRPEADRPDRIETVAYLALIVTIVAWAVLAFSLLAAPAAGDPGHNGTHTPTPTPDLDDGATAIKGDTDIRVTDYRYDRDRQVMTVVFQADEPQAVYWVTPPNDAGHGYIDSAAVGEGRTVLTITTPEGKLWVSTKDSQAEGWYTELDATGAPLIGGPYGSDDVRNGILWTLVTGALVLLVVAVRARLGLDDQGGWIA